MSETEAPTEYQAELMEAAEEQVGQPTTTSPLADITQPPTHQTDNFGRPPFSPDPKFLDMAKKMRGA